MSRINISVTLLLLQFFSSSSYASLEDFILTGEQVVFEFDASVFELASTTASDGASFNFSFANSYAIGGLDDPFLYEGHLELGESVKFDFYEDQADENPFLTWELEGQEPGVSGYSYVWFDILGDGSAFIPWQDQEGSIVMTVLAGEVELLGPHVGLYLYEGGTEYSAQLTAAVPIPAAVWLFGSALAGLGWMRRK
jgi:hypothetical protein